jgi:hypothetical protein
VFTSLLLPASRPGSAAAPPPSGGGGGGGVSFGRGTNDAFYGRVYESRRAYARRASPELLSPNRPQIARSASAAPKPPVNPCRRQNTIAKARAGAPTSTPTHSAARVTHGSRRRRSSRHEAPSCAWHASRRKRRKRHPHLQHQQRQQHQQHQQRRRRRRSSSSSSSSSNRRRRRSSSVPITSSSSGNPCRRPHRRPH